MTNAIGYNKLCLIVDKLTIDFLHLFDNFLLNKMKWGVGIIRGVYTLGVWFGGNKPHKPYFIW